MRPHCHAGIAGPRVGRGIATATALGRPERQTAGKAVCRFVSKPDGGIRRCCTQQLRFNQTDARPCHGDVAS
jgi:hypothetical protein